MKTVYGIYIVVTNGKKVETLLHSMYRKKHNALQQVEFVKQQCDVNRVIINKMDVPKHWEMEDVI